MPDEGRITYDLYMGVEFLRIFCYDKNWADVVCPIFLKGTRWNEERVIRKAEGNHYEIEL